MNDLRGKTAIVTGASRGIGQATALELAQRGVNLVLVARTSQALEETYSQVEALGARVWARKCDVSSYTEVEGLVQGALERFSRLDMLINNAASIHPIARLEIADPETWAHLIGVNLIGAFNTCRAVLPHFLEHDAGVIVNLSSGAAHQALEGWSAYCASKAGLAMLTKSLALEVAGQGVRVYGFGPGVVDTEMQSHIRASGINPISQLPRETLADPRDPARVIAWLCSSEAADLAGQELSIRDQTLRQRAGLEEPA